MSESKTNHAITLNHPLLVELSVSFWIIRLYFKWFAQTTTSHTRWGRYRDFIYCKGSTHARTQMIQISSTVLQKKGGNGGILRTISFHSSNTEEKKGKDSSSVFLLPSSRYWKLAKVPNASLGTKRSLFRKVGEDWPMGQLASAAEHGYLDNNKMCK